MIDPTPAHAALEQIADCMDKIRAHEAYLTRAWAALLDDLRRAREAGIADTTIAETAGISEARVDELHRGGQ